MFDFSKINAENKPLEIDPRDIFMSLPTKNKEYSYLRDVQSEVLKKWFDNRDNKNSIIKMNTGSGKTVVALLTLQSSLNENKGPVVYVVPDSYLIEQVCIEAKKLGISVTNNPRDYSFVNKKSILVIHISKLVNGKSIFGMSRPVFDNIKIGSVVIDDVHACIESIEEQYRISLPSNIKVYTAVIKELEESIKSYSFGDYTDLFHSSKKDYAMILPFWIWQKKVQDIKNIIAGSNDSAIKNEVMFKLPLIDDVFHLCSCAISKEKIEIMPKCIPINKIESFMNADRRIFLSATLSDDSVFAHTFGLKKGEINNIITPERANDLGDRLMLFPEFLNASIQRDDIKIKLVDFSKKVNVVVLVPSFKKAEYWRDVSGECLATTNGNLKEGIERLKNSTSGLTVIVNKYDGVDLPDDACRVLVIDDLPAIRSVHDVAMQLVNPNDVSLLRSRVQKIEQGMGRGVRSNTDYCVIVFLGKTLTKAITSNEGINFFSDSTKAQYKISMSLWDQLYESNSDIKVDSIFKLAEYSLKRDVGWIKASKEALNKINYKSTLNIDATSIAIRESFDYAVSGDYNKAFLTIEEVKNSIEDKRVKGHLMQLMAEYKNFNSKSEAQVILESAKQYNSNVVKPIEGIKYNKTTNNCSQGGKIKNFLNVKNKNDHLLEVESICEDLVFKENSSNKFEEAIKKIFHVLGFVSIRPESENKRGGPDNLVTLRLNKYLIIECKNECKTNQISKRDCNQMGGSIQWFKSKYRGENITCYPIIIHNSDVFADDASPNEIVRIMTPKMLNLFTVKIKEFYIELYDDEKLQSESEIAKLLTFYNLTPEGIIDSFTKKFKNL